MAAPIGDRIPDGHKTGRLQDGARLFLMAQLLLKGGEIGADNFIGCRGHFQNVVRVECHGQWHVPILRVRPQRCCHNDSKVRRLRPSTP